MSEKSENLSLHQQFISRKNDHIHLSLDPENEASGLTGLDQVQLLHDSLPDLNLNEVSIETSFLDRPLATPFFISGMTAGHENAQKINLTLGALAANRGWLMGVGSQRRELENKNYSDASIFELSKRYSSLKLIANFGIAQVIEANQNGTLARINEIANQMNAVLIAIHLNPLQEAIQAEGTPNFKGSWDALQKLSEISSIPIIVKETGSGMSEVALEKLSRLKLFAVDVSGLGGTHWGRIEGKRASANSVSSVMGGTFKNWGISTVESVLHAEQTLRSPTEVWASGGVRSGLDAAKLIALGAKRIGFAKPALAAALAGEKSLELWMQIIEQELKVALFCTNTKDVGSLNSNSLRGVF